MLLYGDWMNEIEFRRGEPVAIWPIPPWLVEIRRGNNGYLFYDVNMPSGEQRRLSSERVLHIKNLSVDGLRGMSCIRAGAEAIGLSLATEEFGSKFFSQGANLSGIAEHPGKLSDEAYKRLVKDLPEKYAGLGNAHRIMLLEEGMKFQRIGIPPNEGQFLETRKFQVAEIGRLFGISQLHKIGDLERATFSNIEEQNIDFVVDTIRPILVNIEQEFNYKLFRDDEYFAEFVIDGLLRGNIQNRYQAYATARQWGWMSANDVLELENMNPLPGDQGDIYYMPMNMIPADQAKEPEEPQEDRSLKKKTEQRQRSAALTRSRAAKSYESVFVQAARKVCTREKTNVSRALNKHLGERGLQTFEQWLEDFYREFRPYVERTMRPAIMALSETIRELAKQEVGADEADIQTAVDDFVQAQAFAHTERSEAVIRQLIRKAEEENLDTIATVTERLGEWEENRPAQIANDSTTAVASKVAKTVFIGAGIQRLRWVAVGAETCPYCQEMDGRIVSVDQPFLSKDDRLESEDGRMPINKPTTEPPLHKGCVCTVVAE